MKIEEKKWGKLEVILPYFFLYFIFVVISLGNCETHELKFMQCEHKK